LPAADRGRLGRPPAAIVTVFAVALITAITGTAFRAG
jgi:hypothetical protein